MLVIIVKIMPINGEPSDMLRGLPEGGHHQWYILLLVSCSPAELTSSSDVRCKYQRRSEIILNDRPAASALYLFNSLIQQYFFLTNLSLIYPINCPTDGGNLSATAETTNGRWFPFRHFDQCCSNR